MICRCQIKAAVSDFTPLTTAGAEIVRGTHLLLSAPVRKVNHSIQLSIQLPITESISLCQEKTGYFVW